MVVVSKQAPYFPNSAVWGSAGISTPVGGPTRRMVAGLDTLDLATPQICNMMSGTGDRYPDMLFRTIAR